MIRYQFSISHVPGKDLHIADTLSRAPTSPNTPTNDHFCQQVDNFVHLVMESLPITEERLLQISRMQNEDTVCQELKQYCLQGWPESSMVKGSVKLYRQVSSEISVQDVLYIDEKKSDHHPISAATRDSEQDSCRSPGHPQVPGMSMSIRLVARY